jgi:hypothetical protein
MFNTEGSMPSHHARMKMRPQIADSARRGK